MKKLIAMLLALVMLFSMVACGAKEENPAPEAAPEAATDAAPEAAPEAAELEEATIQLWIAGPGKQKDTDMVVEEFNKLLQKYVPNTTVEIETFDLGAYSEKFNQMLASGEAVDLAFVANWVTGYENLVQDGSLMPLNDLIEAYGQDMAESLGDKVLDAHRWSDGELYAVINWQGLVGLKSAYYIPTELAELAGDTWLEDTKKVVDKWWNNYEGVEDLQAFFDQWEIYFAAAKDAGKLYAGIPVERSLSVAASWYNVSQMFPYNGSNYVAVTNGDDSFTVVDTIDTEYVKTWFANMADFYEKGYVRSDAASFDTSMEHFVTGGAYDNNTNIVYTHNYRVEGDFATTQAGAGVDLSVIPIESNPVIELGFATANAIPYCADEPERAMMVLNAINTVPELYQLLVYGIEGTHYTDNGDGTIATSYPEQSSAEDDYGQWNWTVGNCRNSLMLTGQDPEYYTSLAAAEEDAVTNPLIGFVFDKTNVEGIMAALTAIDGEYVPRLKAGYDANWEATYAKYVQERKDAGVDELVAEYQKQLNAYIEANGITGWN